MGVSGHVWVLEKSWSMQKVKEELLIALTSLYSFAQDFIEDLG